MKNHGFFDIIYQGTFCRIESDQAKSGASPSATDGEQMDQFMKFQFSKTCKHLSNNTKTIKEALPYKRNSPNGHS